MNRGNYIQLGNSNGNGNDYALAIAFNLLFIMIKINFISQLNDILCHCERHMV